MAFLRSYSLVLHVILLIFPGIFTQETVTTDVPSSSTLSPTEAEQEAFEEAIRKDPLQYLFEASRQEKQFKFIIEAGAHECYYQEVPPGHTIHFTASVYSDDAGPNAERIKYLVHFVNNDTADTVVAHEESTPEASYEFWTDSETGGTYSICFDNPRVSTKLMWLTTVYYKAHKTIPTAEGAYLPGSKLAVASFMERMNKMEEKISAAINHLTHFRFAVAFDHKMQQGSQHFITIWSVLECLIMLGIGLLQLHFLKKFFEQSDERVRPKTLRPLGEVISSRAC